MEPQKSTAEAWKYVNEGSDRIYQFCGKHYTGSTTETVDHLLGASNGNGGGIEGCPKISDEQKDAVWQEHGNSKRRSRNELKRQRIQREITMSSSLGIPSFTSNFSGSSSTPEKIGGASTLNAFYKPVEKQQVDDAIADFFLCMCNSISCGKKPIF